MLGVELYNALKVKCCTYWALSHPPQRVMQGLNTLTRRFLAEKSATSQSGVKYLSITACWTLELNFGDGFRYLIFLWSCFSVLLPASIAVIVCFQQTKILHPLHIINVFFWITWTEGLGSQNASLLKTKSTESCNRIQFFSKCTTV